MVLVGRLTPLEAAAMVVLNAVSELGMLTHPVGASYPGTIKSCPLFERVRPPSTYAWSPLAVRGFDPVVGSAML